MPLFARLFARQAHADDPLLDRLPDLPVVQSAAGTFVQGFERDEQQSTLTKAEGDDRKSGAVAQYALQWNRPVAAIEARLAAGDTTPFLQWVRQLVVLLTDAESAAHWFGARTSDLKQFEGNDVGGFRYGHVTVASLPFLGDEANLILAPNENRGNPFHDTHVHFRSGRLIGTVSASAIFGDPRIQTELKGIAEGLARKIEDALATGDLTAGSAMPRRSSDSGELLARIKPALLLMLAGPTAVALGYFLASAGYEIGGVLIVLGLFIGMFLFIIGYRVLRGGIALKDLRSTLLVVVSGIVGLFIVGVCAQSR